MHPTTRRFTSIFLPSGLARVLARCSASRGRFLQWMLAKLFLTVEALEERRLICFSKRHRGERKIASMSSWMRASPGYYSRAYYPGHDGNLTNFPIPNSQFSSEGATFSNIAPHIAIRAPSDENWESSIDQITSRPFSSARLYSVLSHRPHTAEQEGRGTKDRKASRPPYPLPLTPFVPLPASNPMTSRHTIRRRVRSGSS